MSGFDGCKRNRASFLDECLEPQCRIGFVQYANLRQGEFACVVKRFRLKEIPGFIVVDQATLDNPVSSHPCGKKQDQDHQGCCVMSIVHMCEDEILFNVVEAGNTGRRWDGGIRYMLPTLFIDNLENLFRSFLVSEHL